MVNNEKLRHSKSLTWCRLASEALLATVAGTIGFLNVTFGATSESSYYLADTLVRAIGVAFLVSVALVVARRWAGWVAAAACFVASAFEVLLSWMTDESVPGAGAGLVSMIFVALSCLSLWASRGLPRRG
jgi:hypothetical protein